MLELLQYRAWALSEAYFDKMYPVVVNAIRLGHNLIQKKTMEDFIPRIEALFNIVDPDTDETKVAIDGWTGETIIPTVKVDGKTIALIPIIGPISKYGGMCSYGGQDYQRFINIANKAPEIDGIVLIMDTPGGTVDGTPELGFAVKNNPKPVGVFGDSMVASAGMWIASQASVIVGNKNNPTEFGSIDVYMIDEDWTNVMDAGQLPRMKIIRAPQSKDKALVNPIEPTSEEMEKELKEGLRDVASTFIATVKAGRGDKLDLSADGLFTGKMFDVYKAKQIGLIDHIGTLETAVKKVAALAKEKSKQGTSGGSPNANTMKFKSGLLSAIFGKSEKAEEEKPTAEEQQKKMEAADAKAAEMEAENLKLKEEKQAADQKVTQLEATVAEQKTQITNLETKVAEQKAELDKQPTGQKTTVIADDKKEGEQAGDGKNSATNGKYRTKADEESDKYLEATTLTLPKK